MDSSGFRCKCCGERFEVVHHLIAHYDTHKVEVPFLVERNDTNNNSYKDEQPTSCNQSDKKFNNTQDLIYHHQVHTVEKLFKCKLCDQRFARSSDLKQHSQIHTKNKPFKCEYCDKKFASLYYLRTRHLQIHKKEKGACSTGKSEKSTSYAAPAAPYAAPAETRNGEIVKGNDSLQESNRSRRTVQCPADSVEKEPTVATPIGAETPASDVSESTTSEAYTSYATPTVATNTPSMACTNSAATYDALTAYAYSAAYPPPAIYPTYATPAQTYVAQAETYAAPAFNYAASAISSSYSASGAHPGYASFYGFGYHY